MTLLIIGLILFLGTHSVRIVADSWRTQQIARLGAIPWKLAYTALSVAGIALIVWGYAQARLDPVWLWTPPVWTRHLAAALTLPALILITAAYVPGTVMRARLGHPMLAGTKLWALSHLLANGTLADLLLFGGFLIWASAAFVACRRRDRAAASTPRPGTPARDLLAAAIAVIAWYVLARHLHAILFGVQPFG